MSAGMNCAETLTDKTAELSLDETLDFLEPQAARSCVPVPDMNICSKDQSTGTHAALPARSGALCQSSDDWNKMKTALEQACKKLKCSREIQQVIERLQGIEKVGKAKK